MEQLAAAAEWALAKEEITSTSTNITKRKREDDTTSPSTTSSALPCASSLDTPGHTTIEEPGQPPPAKRIRADRIEGQGFRGGGRRKGRAWTTEEDEILKKAVQHQLQVYGKNDWKLIASQLKSRTNVQCLHRWKKVVDPEIVKGPWTKEEDASLANYVKLHGTNWALISKKLGGRIGKQCRERWWNHVNPEIKKTPWSEEEDAILLQSHQEIGNKWVELAKRLPGRTPNGIKNHWNSRLIHSKNEEDAEQEEEIREEDCDTCNTAAPGSSGDHNHCKKQRGDTAVPTPLPFERVVADCGNQQQH